jgi:hypothetical protein
MASQQIVSPEDASEKDKELITIAMWASEPIPFDARKSLHTTHKKKILQLMKRQTVWNLN